MVYILVNPKSGGEKAGDLKEQVLALPEFQGKEGETRDVTELGEYVPFLKGLAAEDEVVFVGGDGTLNYLVNHIRGYRPANRIYMYAAGTGNDFMTDVLGEKAKEQKLLDISEYILDLPVAVIDGQAYTFIDNVAYGLDGEVCVLGEDAKAAGAEKVNYTSLAIKLLMRYKVCKVRVTVDGVVHEHEKAWLAPVMKGKYYGGGMMIAPKQDRKSGNISVTLFCGSGRLRTLMIFPKIFTGEHVNYKKYISIYEGKDIEVEMEVPKHVHIDGEVVRDVKSLRCYTGEAAHAYDLYTPDGEKK